MSQQTINGCGNISKIHYIIYGIISISILPFAIWCCYKHIKHHRSTSSNNKLLFRLSIAVYICTILGSIFTTTTSFGACIIPPLLWFNIWNLQGLCWISQWFFFIWLLFSRSEQYIHMAIYMHPLIVNIH